MWWMVFLVFGLVLAACTPPAPTSAPGGESAAPAQATGGEEKVLRVWITWGDNPAQLQSLFNQYGEANNVRVEVNSPVEDDKVIAALSGTEPPDVLVTGGPDSVGTWARENLVTPLDDFLEGGEVDLADIFEAPLSQCLYQGKYYCLPWGTDTYALFWNKDLFEEAGLDPEQPPQTLEELAEFARKLTKVDDNGQITQVGFIPDFSWSHLGLYTVMMGGYWYSEDGTQLQLTSEPVINALKWEQQFYCDYNVDEVLRFSSSFGGYASPDNGFYAGKIAMQVEGEWQPGPNFIQKYKPELYYGVAPLPPPAAHPERAGTNLVSGTVAMIPSGVKDKEAAWKLMAWMMSPEIVAEEMVANFNLPSSKKAAEDPRFRENEKFVVFLELMGNPNARAPILTPINAEVETELGQIEEQVLHTCADPEPLLQAAQEKLQPLLDKALGN
ncbi:ABC transporter substrate-binding protein [Litorilinea aerophila]|nr:ABC transporter substrate-binding protein [Litorilinea aerophila]MCC9077019.1 ABC transporter substrate-binding protein [Litorilinea aerophila]